MLFSVYNYPKSQTKSQHVPSLGKEPEFGPDIYLPKIYSIGGGR